MEEAVDAITEAEDTHKRTVQGKGSAKRKRFSMDHLIVMSVSCLASLFSPRMTQPDFRDTRFVGTHVALLITWSQDFFKRRRKDSITTRETNEFREWQWMQVQAVAI